MTCRSFTRFQTSIPVAMVGLHSDTHDAISLEKRQIRLRMKSASENVPAEQIVNESRILTAQVLSSEWYRRCSRLSIYVSTFGEADTTSIIRESILNGKQVFIPNFQRGSNKMDMLRVASEDEFENLGAVLWGIRQHTHPCDELSWRHSGALDVIVVPGVAFTIKGQRLGHGKGFYDRFIAEHRQMFCTAPLSVALALSYQIVESLPTTETDASIDHVLLPTTTV
uniref:5-formyltetrahydrofolate cyclo-ligase n=2 Tax=Ascaris TaxID=6251 RepID=A0A0M3HV41_ASCLU